MKQIRINNILVLTLILVFIGSCSEAELPVYNVNEQAINFWAEPTLINPNPAYPGDLKENYDFGSFANFLKRGYTAFTDVHTLDMPVQIQGYPITDDRKIFFIADSVQSGDGLDITFSNYYVMQNGNVTAKFPYGAKAIPPDEITTIVFTFDYEKSEFLPGVKERQYYTLTCTNSTGRSAGIPANIAGFNPSQFWDIYALAYGIQGYTKFKFLALVFRRADFSGLPYPDTTAGMELVDRLNTSLIEYKELNAQFPEVYPPLYNDGTQTWISFP